MGRAWRWQDRGSRRRRYNGQWRSSGYSSGLPEVPNLTRFLPALSSTTRRIRVASTISDNSARRHRPTRFRQLTVSYISPTTTGAAANAFPGFVAGSNGVYQSTAATGAYTCGDGIVTIAVAGNPTYKPALCSPQVIAPVLHIPYYLSYSLSVQHAFTNNLTIDIAYVGNTGVHLDGTLNENAPTPGGNTPGVCSHAVNSAISAASPIEQCRRPFDPALPFYSSIILDSGFGFANYNAPRSSATHQRNAAQPANYASLYMAAHAERPPRWKTLLPAVELGGSTGNPLDFTITGTWTTILPKIKSPAQMLEGWELNTTVYMLSGAAATATDAADDLSGTGQGQDHWNILGTPEFFTFDGVGHPVSCYGIARSSPWFAKRFNCQTVSTPTGCTTITTANAAGCTQGMPSICVNGAAAARVTAGDGVFAAETDKPPSTS